MLPTLNDHAGYTAAKQKCEQAVAELSTANRERVQAERGLHLPEGLSANELRTHIAQAGISDGEKYVEARDRLKVLDRAATTARGELERQTNAARVEVGKKIEADHYTPALKAAALACVGAVRATLAAREMFEKIKADGFNVEVGQPLPDVLPMNPSDPSAFMNIIGRWQRLGLIDDASLDGLPQ